MRFPLSLHAVTAFVPHAFVLTSTFVPFCLIFFLFLGYHVDVSFVHMLPFFALSI